jgi:hypothetical protein
MTSIRIDDIAPPSSGNAWKPEIGDIAKGEITYLAKQSPRPSYDKNKMEQEVRLDLIDSDTTITVYITINNDVEGDGYPKRDARAVAAAVRAAGCTDLEMGGYLAIQRVEDVPTTFQPARDYVAEYRAPKAKPVSVPVGALTGSVEAPGPSLKSLIGD